MNTLGRAVWLFGSYARGEEDELSDVDLLEVHEVRGSDRANFTEVGLSPATMVCPSFYTWRQIEEMSGYGSLFLHHVSLERVPVFEEQLVEGRLRGILDTLPPYSRAGFDLYGYKQAVKDVAEGCREDEGVDFELSILATTLRHVAVLGCYLRGVPTFGRLSAIDVYLDLLGCTEADRELAHWLMRFKMWAQRGGAERPVASRLKVEASLQLVHELVANVEKDLP